MPPILIAAAGAAAAWGASTLAAGAVIAGITISAATASLIGAAAGLLVSTGLTLLLKSAAPSAAKQADARFQTYASGVAPRQIVYGKALVTGPMVFATSYGTYNEWVHVVVPIADHAIQGFDAIWINGFRIPLPASASANGDGTTGAGTDGHVGLYTVTQVLIPNGSAAGNVSAANVFPFPAVLTGFQMGDGEVVLYLYDGTQTAASPFLIADAPAEWTAAHKMTGVACIYAKIYLARSVFPNGVSTVSAEVRGKVSVYDIRSATTGYSNNPALCILDYLRASNGLAAAADEIDDAFWIAAANVCDEAVATNLSGTETQTRYTLDGSFKLDASPVDIVDRLLTACAGTLVYVAGKYRLYAGAYDVPTVTIDSGDFAGSISVTSAHERRNQFNTITGTYIDPAQNYAAIPFPQVQSAAALASDGEVVRVAVNFPFTIDAKRVQRLARLRLLVHRVAGLRVEAVFKYGMLRMSVWDTVALTFAEFGWAGQVFRCTKWGFDPGTGMVTASLQAEDSAAHTWTYSDAAAPFLSSTTALVSRLVMPTLAAPTVTPYLTGTISYLNVAWLQPASPYATGVEVQWRRRKPMVLNYAPWFGNRRLGTVADDTDWQTYTVNLPVIAIQIVPVISGQTYDVRVRALDGPITGPWSGTTIKTSL